jgi:uncharacterized protein
MLAIVLDTNVIISAGLTPRGTAAKIVHNWLLTGPVPILTCPSVLAEYLEVTRRSKFAKYDFPPQWLNRLIVKSQKLPEPSPWAGNLPDPKDKPFLALAKATGATLITGNLKHFPKSARDGVKVLSPDEYLAWLLHED